MNDITCKASADKGLVSPPMPEAPDPASLNQAIHLMESSEKQARLLPRLMKLLLASAVTNLLCLLIISALVWKICHTEHKYFATDEGRLVRLAPTNQPAWSQDDVIAYGNKVLMRAFNLDFVHYREQIASMAPDFSDGGYDGYVHALKSSNILDAIKKERMNLSSTTGAGVVVRTGRLSDGTWFWVLQYPVRMRLTGQTTSRPENAFIFEITIQRVDGRIKPAGMEISQTISRNAPRTP